MDNCASISNCPLVANYYGHSLPLLYLREWLTSDSLRLAIVSIFTNILLFSVRTIIVFDLCMLQSRIWSKNQSKNNANSSKWSSIDGSMIDLIFFKFFFLVRCRHTVSQRTTIFNWTLTIFNVNVTKYVFTWIISFVCSHTRWTSGQRVQHSTSDSK